MADYALTISEAELARYQMMAQRAIASEAEEFRLAGIRTGAAIADVGCGPAALSVHLAQLVGPSGQVVAIEPDERSRATAAAVIEAAGTSNVHLRAGTASDTGLEPASMDVVMMRHVLAHNGGREQEFVDHLATRVRPGGTVYLVDVDLNALHILDSDPDLADLPEKYVAFHRERGNDPRVGMRLAQMLSAANLDVLTFVGRYAIAVAPAGMRPPAWAARDAMLADGIVSQSDIERWATAFDRLDTAPVRPTIFAPTFIAVGGRV
jgi:ubiquinone/menaquinone biosynthesis C-methylase UbiE